MEYIYFEFDNISSRTYNVIIQNAGEDLSFPSQAAFENQIIAPLYQNTSFLGGVQKKDREFKFNCFANNLNLDLVRAMLHWLSVDKIAYLILDYNPNFKYQVKIQSISDLKHLAYNDDGTSNYDFTISFTTIGENSSLSIDKYHITEADYLAILQPTQEDIMLATPRGTNKDNSGPIVFRDPYDLVINPLNPEQQIPRFKIFNYYSLPFDAQININSTNGFTVNLNDTTYYSYLSYFAQNFSIDSKNGFVKIDEVLAESSSYVQLNTNLGRMEIPGGNTQTLIAPLSNVIPVAPNPLLPEFTIPLYINIYDANDIIYYENLDDLYIIVQDGSYGENSTNSYNPIDKESYIYNKINKDGSNSNVDILQFNPNNSSEASVVGQLSWSPSNGTFNMALYNDVTLQVGEELLFYVTAEEDIKAGEPIMFSNFNPLTNQIFVKGSDPSILKISGYFYVGVATKDITQGNGGYATLFGIVNNLNFLNLAANPYEIAYWQSGTVLYIDPNNNGKLTYVAPVAPELKIIVGAVIIPDYINTSDPFYPMSASSGQMIISTTQGIKISSLYDVVATNPNNGDTLVYRDGVWNAEASFNAAGSITVQDEAEVFTSTNVEDALYELYINKVSTDPDYGMVLNSEINKLATVSANANQNVNADWNATEGDALILNKPNISAEYQLPIASNLVLGGVKIDNSTITINEFGTISSISGNGSVAEVTVSSPLNVTNGTTAPHISINEATSSTAGIMSVEDKNKLDSVQSGAEMNVNADWNAVSGDALILNKPNIPTQYTDSSARDAVGNILTNSSSINLVYNTNLNTISAFANFGTTPGTITQGNDSRLSDARTPVPHSHGNINSAGQIGAVSNLVVTTGANGVLTTATRSGIDSRATFPPDTHIHTTSQITGLDTVLSGKAKIATNEGSATAGQLLQANGNQTFTYATINAENLSIQDLNDNYDSSYVEGALEEVAIKDNYLENLFLLDHSTGVYEFGGLTKVDDTHFSVGAMKGYIVDNITDPENPTIQYIEYIGSESVLDTNIGTSYQTQIFINNNGELVLDNSDLPSCPERRDSIYLGRSVHPSTIITAVENVPDFIQSPASQLRDLWKGLGVINDKNYVYSNNTPSTNLNLALHGGTLYYNGINYISNPKRPNRKTIDSQTTLTFNYRTQTGSGSNGITLLDPTYYDNAGTVTAVPNPGATSTNQRVYLSPTGLVLIQYGQTLYDNLDDAIAAVSTEPFITATAIQSNAVLIGVISISKDATNLTSAYAKFHTVSKFGELSGSAGGGGTAGSGLAIDVEFTPAGDIAATNVQSAIQELDTEKAAKASPTFTGDVVIGDPLNNNVTISNDEILILGSKVWHAGNDGTGSGLDADTLDGLHASSFTSSNSPTFTGTVVLPSTTSIGIVSSTELGYIYGVTSSIQTQLNSKAFFNSTPASGSTFYSGGGDNALQTLSLGTSGQVLSVGSGKPAWATLTSSSVGLGNVTNESKATMFASPTFTGTVSGVTKAMVGLSNVENYSLSSILQAVYPIGSIYISTVSTSPATLFGFGTWVAFAAGKTLIGLSSSDTDFDVSEETGGSKTHLHSVGAHTHTVDSHTHTIASHSHTVNDHSHTVNSHAHGLGGGYALLNFTTSRIDFYEVGVTTWSRNHSVNPTQTYSSTAANISYGVGLGGWTDAQSPGTGGSTPGTSATSLTTNATSGSTAGNTAFDSGSTSSLPPYIVTYMWKRTA